MRKIFFNIFLTLLLVGLFISNQYAFAKSLDDDYLGIKLTSPIKSKNIVKLYSKDGFAIYEKDDILDELEYFETENINVILGRNGEITIFDNNDEVLFSFYEEDDIIIGSGSRYDNKIKVEDKYYRDYIYFIGQGNELIVINYVKLDNYLYGVVPREMPASFPMESLKAQAVAARTYALKNRNKHIKEGYNLCDTTHCQVYGGMDGEHERTNTAVDETMGMVITYNGNIIDALYHSNSGGHTEDAVEAWGNSFPYLTAVEDEFSQGSPNSNWSFKMTSDEIDIRLRNIGINIGDVLNMEVLETSSSGRVLKLKVLGTLGEEVLNKDKIRQVLGTSELKSTWFTIKKEGDTENNRVVYAIDGDYSNPQKIDINNSHILDGNLKKSPSRSGISRAINRDNIVQIGNITNPSVKADSFLIKGKGYGHGVGMSQWGAKGMAELGYSFEDILKHYYKGVEIDIKN